MFEEKIKQLELEFERGQEQLAYLDQRRAELRDTLLRISGAIQVLREMQQTMSAAPEMAAPGMAEPVIRPQEVEPQP